MSEIVSNFKDNLEAILNSFREELVKIRTGRITPAVVEDILVEAYATKMSLKELAAISVPEPRQLLIEPWDKGVLEEVEHALTLADLGALPVVVGGAIRLSFPSLTSESREILLKAVGKAAGETKARVRRARQKVRQEVEGFKASEGEDFVFRLEKEVDKVVEVFGRKIEELMQEKEEEIRG